MKKWTLVVLALALVSCGKDDAENNDPVCGEADRCAPETDDGTVTPDPTDMGQVTADSGMMQADQGNPDPDMSTTPDMPNPMSCNRVPRPENGPRKVIVALPFTDTMYEVFDLDAAGVLSRPNVMFNMGRAFEGEIHFTPDGEVGFVAQDDGTIGVFRMNQAGQPEVLAANLDPGFYVSGVIVDATGDNLYAWETGFRKLDDGTANGAMYRMPIACATGLPGEAEELFRGKLIRGASWLSDTQLGVAAVDLLDDETPHDGHVVDVSGPTRIASQSAFADDEAITVGFATTADGQYMLLGDNAAFTEQPNRVGIMAIFPDSLAAIQVIELADPVQIVTSPFNNAALVLSTTDDTLNVLDYNPTANATAFNLRGPLSTTAPVLLPGSATMVTRGDLEGLVLVGENVGVRRVQFEQNGDVTDLGLLELGTGVESITGAVGVQP